MIAQVQWPEVETLWSSSAPIRKPEHNKYALSPGQRNFDQLWQA